MSQLTHPVFPRNLLLRAGIDFLPTDDRILIAKLPDERFEQATSRIIAGPSVNRRRVMHPTWGQVLRVGPEVELVHVDDYVRWEWTAGMDARWDSHFDINHDGAFLSPKDRLPQKRRFVILRESECNLICRMDEDGERLPELRDEGMAEEMPS